MRFNRRALTSGRHRYWSEVLASAIKGASQVFYFNYHAALAEAGVRHTFHRYDGAGHAFQNFPSKERYREKQSEDAWEKVRAFLQEQLG
ncbi:MAG: dienelactone hydrolase family protein [Gammaproteobacteria bacterium]|nr:dienelactone hydrolase family protein [Gammaproteobacteria bacterium]